MIELLSPAGNAQKLSFAYAYGADAAYMGVDSFSLRSRSGSVDFDNLNSLSTLRKDKKLYGALNIFFSEKDLDELKEKIDLVKDFDALIVSDLGCAYLLQEHFDDLNLHLSTQANSINSKSVKMYAKMGFKRIILGREATLDDIKRIKDANPDVEIEAFVHGAMCMAYSGRCLLSAHMSQRSANKGGCAHSCRWKYNLHSSNFAIEEEQRPNELYPIEEFDKGTVILSSQDLCMIDHVKELVDAGLDSLKIEGRMKSIYYVATITRAYRKAIDYALGKIKYDDFSPFRDEVLNVSHREFSTGFYFPEKEVSQQEGEEAYMKEYLFLGSIVKEIEDGIYLLDVKNQIRSFSDIQAITAQVLSIPFNDFQILDEKFNPIEKIDHGKIAYLKTDRKLEPNTILRRLNN